MPQTSPDDAHFKRVISSFTKGQIVPFLGAGANMCGRPDGTSWHGNQREHLPNGGELSAHLESRFYLQDLTDDERGLMRVSQYVETFEGRGSLYNELHDLFDRPYRPTRLHEFLAQLPATLRAHNYPRNTSDPCRLRFTVVTTNYDDLLERAFADAGEPCHVISYRAEFSGRQGGEGKFMHWPAAGGRPTLIDQPNKFSGFDDDDPYPFPVVLKIHGAVDRLTRPGEDSPLSSQDSFVITEDQYIDYLLIKDIMRELPASISAQLMQSQFLFLGYKLRDWNLRAILRRIWLEQGAKRYNSFAVMKDCTENEQKYWHKHDLEAFATDVGVYVDRLAEVLRNWQW